MKLLGWMHRKLRQNNNDVFKDFNGGGGSCSCLSRRHSPDDSPRHHDDRFVAAGEFLSSDSGDGAADLFALGGGLLAIGTLGIAAVPIPEDGDGDGDGEGDGDPLDLAGDATPAFGPVAAAAEKAATVEAIAEKEDDATTEGDLMVVSAELEKVLAAEAAAAGGDAISSARVSFAAGCPLQGFLFGSPASEAAGDHRARRASLGELFMRTRFAEEPNAGGGDGGDAGNGGGSGGEGKEEEKSKGLRDKLAKKTKARDDKLAGGAAASIAPPAAGSAAKSKFHKILQIFHRKVYPENSVLTRNLTKHRKRGAPDHEHNGGNKDPRSCGAKEVAASKLPCRKECMLSFSCCSNHALFGPDKSDSNVDKSGHWIKTDADYLVLEL